MKIRNAQPGDEDGIARVHVNSWRSTYAGLIAPEVHPPLKQRRESWKQSLDEITAGSTRRAIFVVENEQGKICGFAAGGQERTNHSEFDSELYAIYLEETAQSRGAGSRLTLALANWLRSQGFSKMLLWVLEANPSRRFYERIGGQLLPEKKSFKLGGQQYAEVAYGFELARMIEVLTARGIAGR